MGREKVFTKSIPVIFVFREIRSPMSSELFLIGQQNPGIGQIE